MLKKDLGQRIKFEELLTDISISFVNQKPHEVDPRIELGLKKILEFLDIGRGVVYQYSDQDEHLRLTHSYGSPTVASPPLVLSDIFPVWAEMVQQGELYYISDTAQLPDEQWQEKAVCKRMELKSILLIPLKMAGKVLGVISFFSFDSNYVWHDETIQRIRVIGNIFSSAIERKRADQKIQKAFKEIEHLKNRLEVENIYLRDQINLEHKYEKIIGNSEALRKVLGQLELVAQTSSTVLLLGETGTGKELMATAIHNLSSRKDRTFIKLNCATLPATLIESELFGHEKGAFTGAITQQTGRFEAAHGSSIFLDEIGELPLELQAKLLRVLQEGQFERLGSPKTIHIDVRVIAATNKDLIKAVEEGTFREDLYYRLNVFPVSIPPLRERTEDIPLLVWSMLAEFSETFGKTIDRVHQKTMEALQNYGWPGNIRELRNVIERAAILATSQTLNIDLPGGNHDKKQELVTFEEMARRYLLTILEKTRWKIRGKNGASELLDLKPSTLESKMKKLGIVRPS